MNFEGIDDEVPEEVGRQILSFLDVPTLVQKKAVCRSWQILFTNTIHAKASTPKAFRSRAELRKAVYKYTKYNPVDAEAFAETYGWPIGRWDVSNIQDFRQAQQALTKICLLGSVDYNSKIIFVYSEARVQ
eukprot:scaffold74226_cov51-Attheya_sp.AAC.1